MIRAAGWRLLPFAYPASPIALTREENLWPTLTLEKGRCFTCALWIPRSLRRLPTRLQASTQHSSRTAGASSTGRAASISSLIQLFKSGYNRMSTKQRGRVMGCMSSVSFGLACMSIMVLMSLAHLMQATSPLKTTERGFTYIMISRV